MTVASILIRPQHEKNMHGGQLMLGDPATAFDFFANRIVDRQGGCDALEWR